MNGRSPWRADLGEIVAWLLTALLLLALVNGMTKIVPTSTPLEPVSARNGRQR